MNGWHAPIQYKRNRKKRRYGKKKLKINLTVLVIVVFVIACIVGTVMLGNYLRGKIDPDSSGDLPGGTTGHTPGGNGDGASVSDAAQSHNAKRSGCYTITSKDSDTLLKNAARIFDSGYDSVTVPLTDDDGVLLYDSAAAKALSRQPEVTGLPDLGDIFTAIRNEGDARGLSPTLTVYYNMTYGDTSDAVISEATMLYETAVIAEAYSLGADEVLITGIPVFSDGGSDPDSVLSVIERLRTSAPKIKITLALPYEIFKDRSMSQTLDALADAADALAVDTRTLDWSYREELETFVYTDENGEEVTSTELVRHIAIFDELDRAAAEIRSSASLYSLSYIIYGDVMLLEKEAVDALIKNGVYSYYVVSADEDQTSPPPPDTSNDPDTDDGDEGDGSISAPTTTKKPESTKKPETTTAPPTDPEPGTTAAPDPEPTPTESESVSTPDPEPEPEPTTPSDPEPEPSPDIPSGGSDE